MPKKSIYLIIIIILVFGTISGWLFYFIKFNQLTIEWNSQKSNLSDKNDELENQRSNLVSQLEDSQASLVEKEDQIESLTASLEELNENYDILQAEHDTQIETLDGLREIIDAQRIDGNKCNNEKIALQNTVNDFTCSSIQRSFNYSSNYSIAEDLKIIAGDRVGSIVSSRWEVIWNNAKAAIHYMRGKESTDVYFVFFNEPDLGFTSAVYWASGQCFLDIE